MAAEPLLQTSGGKGGATTGEGAVAGKGADISLLAGNGGDAASGTSGNGGNIAIQPGSPGIGYFSGQPGNVLIAPLSGNVGIGANAPASKLTVEGNIQITGVSNGLKFPDNTVQVTAGLAGIAHNSTLTGEGTPVSPLGVASGQIVKSINTLKDDVVLAAGSNITITPGGNTLTIAATGGGVSHNATLAGDGANGNPLAVSVPLNLSGSNAGAILSVSNTERGHNQHRHRQRLRRSQRRPAQHVRLLQHLRRELCRFQQHDSRLQLLLRKQYGTVKHNRRRELLLWLRSRPRQRNGLRELLLWIPVRRQDNCRL